MELRVVGVEGVVLAPGVALLEATVASAGDDGEEDEQGDENDKKSEDGQQVHL
jgi:hypothetical protein